MDKPALGKQSPEEVTRESLISISYSEPEKIPSPNQSPANGDSRHPVNGVDSDGAEKYRSELISISYQQSPDIEGLPVRPGDHKD